MAAGDVKAQSFLYSWMIPFIIAILAYTLLKKYGNTFKDRMFSRLWSKAMVEYHAAHREMKRIHFNSMNYQKSADPDLKNRGLLRILEIGAGSGANFEFFPPNSQLTVVEPNAFFEPLFYQNQSKHPTVKMEKFVLGQAEDMKGVADNSIDVVVSTLVLCSVDNVKQTLKEVQRVLAPGGKFYFWEHVHDVPGTRLHLIQNILTIVWQILFGCHLNRNLDQIIGSDMGFSSVEQKRFDIPFQKGVWKLVRVHVMGVAIK